MDYRATFVLLLVFSGGSIGCSSLSSFEPGRIPEPYANTAKAHSDLQQTGRVQGLARVFLPYYLPATYSVLTMSAVVDTLLLRVTLPHSAWQNSLLDGDLR